MASVYRPTGRNIYRIEFKDQHGKIKTISSGTDDKRVAENLGMKLEEDADRIRVGMAPKHIDFTAPYLGLVAMTATTRTWKAFRKRYEEEYLAGQRQRTREKAMMVLDLFERECHPQALQDANEQALSTFAAALRLRPVSKRGKPTGQVGLAAWTIKNYLGALRTALSWAVAQKLLRAAPTFPTVKVPKLRPQPIAEADWQKLLAQAPDAHWRAFLLCGWLAGLRLSEARHLRRRPTTEWPWLDFVGDRIVLPARFTKADEDQWVPLHPDLRAALSALPDAGEEVFPFRSRRGGGPLTRNGVTNNVIGLAKKAGVKLSMHRLRKGFGCRVASQLGKGNAPVLHRLMRHTSMQITMDFYASVDDVLHDAIRQLDQGSPASPTASPTTTPEKEKGPTA